MKRAILERESTILHIGVIAMIINLVRVISFVLIILIACRSQISKSAQ